MSKCNHDIQRKTLQWVCKKCDKLFTTMEMARYTASTLSPAMKKQLGMID